MKKIPKNIKLVDHQESYKKKQIKKQIQKYNELVLLRNYEYNLNRMKNGDFSLKNLDNSCQMPPK